MYICDWETWAGKNGDEFLAPCNQTRKKYKAIVTIY